MTGLHAFSLYRSGYAGDEVPWSDNQLWAEGTAQLFNGLTALTLRPVYGSAASWYRLEINLQEGPEVDWIAATVQLSIDNALMAHAPLPLAWYGGAPSDWPSGIVRFPEMEGFHPATFPWPKPGVRGVWTLAARRAL